MAQTQAFQWYQRDLPVALPGMKADATTDVIDSFAAEVALDPGNAVFRGTDEGQVKPVAAAADISKVIGIAVHTHKAYSGEGAYYEEGYVLPVMTFGDVYVEAADTVTAGVAVAMGVTTAGEVGFYDHGATVTTSKTAGKNEYTITTNAAASTDTVTFGGVTLTAGAATNGFSAGSTASETAANLAEAFGDNATLAAIYSFTSDGAKIVVTEIDAGGGNTPGSMTYTGTIVISAGSATSSAATTTTATDVAGMTYLASGSAGDIVPVRIRK